MATLYLATLEGPNGFAKPCVVKRIRSAFSNRESFRQMLGREARVAALLSHPNIVQVFDFGEIDGENFLSMEYVEGASMRAILRQARRDARPLSLAEVAYVGTAMADALDYIHSGVDLDGQRTPLVHRDVSPSNILVSDRGAVKLTDFGIVKVLQAPGLTDAGVVKGKYGYMSPEQVKGQHLDGRSDLFALGAVLWEMLTDRPLFRRPDVAATIAAVLAGRVPRLTDVAPEAPAVMEPILERALAADRRQRYPSARALHDALAALVPSDELAEARRSLAQRAATAESEVDTDSWTGDILRTDDAFVGASSGSLARPLLEDDDEDDGLGTAVWVGLVTAAVVASVLVWWIVLR